MDEWMDGSPLSTGRRSRKAPTSGRKGWERLGWHGTEGMVMARSKKKRLWKAHFKRIKEKKILKPFNPGKKTLNVFVAA